MSQRDLDGAAVDLLPWERFQLGVTRKEAPPPVVTFDRERQALLRLQSELYAYLAGIADAHTALVGLGAATNLGLLVFQVLVAEHCASEGRPHGYALAQGLRAAKFAVDKLRELYRQGQPDVVRDILGRLNTILGALRIEAS